MANIKTFTSSQQKAEICRQYGRWYVSFGATRSTRTYKTVAGAIRYANSRGYTVTKVNPEDVVPLCCIPGTESYMSF